ncbi:MAG: hypothetical protein WAW17_19730 [Rhodococcus sp. (in: high G+C Gram-positive bacteria)]|uniref:hypothetical protein n=1 Tax=Rhodococcus sp. TaxID=1831 RepID=UPI003BAF6330
MWSKDGERAERLLALMTLAAWIDSRSRQQHRSRIDGWLADCADLEAVFTLDRFGLCDAAVRLAEFYDGARNDVETVFTRARELHEQTAAGRPVVNTADHALVAIPIDLDRHLTRGNREGDRDE